MKVFIYNPKQSIRISLFISKIMASSAFAYLYDFHNPIFTKHSIMTPQIRPVDLLSLDIFLSSPEQRQELLIFKTR